MIRLNEKILTSEMATEAVYNACVKLTPPEERPKSADEAIRIVEALNRVRKDKSLLEEVIRRNCL